MHSVKMGVAATALWAAWRSGGSRATKHGLQQQVWQLVAPPFLPSWNALVTGKDGVTDPGLVLTNNDANMTSPISA
jgi:hypothetical protein